MLHENLKQLRQNSGLSQAEAAEQLNVVRQTVSKWESGRSVPDAVMLKRIAELFHTSVGCLLGETSPVEEDSAALEEKLAAINDRLASILETRRRRWHRFFLVSGILLLILFFVSLWSSLQFTVAASFPMLFPGKHSSMGLIGGADGPTSIFVVSTLNFWLPAALLMIAFLACLIGFIKTKQH